MPDLEIADWLQIERQPGWDEFVRTCWPAFVAFKEAGLAAPLAPECHWAFDEFLRQGALFFLSEGKPISIEIPTGNNPTTRAAIPATADDSRGPRQRGFPFAPVEACGEPSDRAIRVVR